MKRTSLIAVGALMTLTALGTEREFVDVTREWQVQPVVSKGVKDKSVCIPAVEDAKLWKEGAMTKHPPRAKGERGGHNQQADYNCWYRRAIDVPAAWKGRSVRFEVPLNCIDAVVFANGRKAGVIYHPGGSVELAEVLDYGRTNRLEVFVTNRAFGTGEKDPFAYVGRDDYARGRDNFMGPAKIAVRAPAFAEDVYVLPSTRRQQIAFRCQVPALTAGKVTVKAEVFEDGGRDPETKQLTPGRLVKTFTGKFALAKGTNTVELVGAWTDPVLWELDRPFLYNCRVTVTGGKAADTTEPLVFGFRELWRAGKDIMMNGHVQRYRGFWNQGLPKEGVAGVKKYGYNLFYQTHQHESYYRENAKLMEECARAGVQVFSGTPTIAQRKGKIVSDPEAETQFRRHLEFWARSHRNLPTIAAASVCVNTMCAAWWMMGASEFGQHPGGTKDIEACIALARPYAENTLYFAHGDGNLGDIGNCNFYFNFVPLQEREEWLSLWASRGVISCYPAEYGAPYYACWFNRSTPLMTEWGASYFGDAAYDEEPLVALEKNREFAKDCLKNYYGGWVKENNQRKDLYAFNPVGRKLNRLLTGRVNRAWRCWGEGPGMMYLVNWKWNDEDEILQVQREYNDNFVGFIGGAGEFTDRKHAYFAGEKVEKCFALAWDGFGDYPVALAWRCVDASGRVVARGTDKVTLKQAEIRFVPFSFTAPDVAAKTAYRIEATFAAKDVPAASAKDVFEIEVAPAGAKATGRVALWDPTGESEKVLRGVGVEVSSCASLDALLAAPEEHLVVGRVALRGQDAIDGVQRLTAAVQGGRHVLLLAQAPETWLAMGLDAEDSMPRTFYNVALDGIDDRDLAYWAGAPLPLRDPKTVTWEHGLTWGTVQDKHRGARAWRWRHTHAPALEVFRIPQRAGFRPLVRGDVDLMYSPLLRLEAGKGTATFCSFDFEQRVGSSATNRCAAAEATAAAVMREYLGAHVAHTAELLVAGEAAKRLAGELGADCAAWNGKAVAGKVILVGKDAAVDFASLRKCAEKGSRVLIVAAPELAQAASFTVAPAELCRYAVDEKWRAFPFAGVGKCLTRWRQPLGYARLSENRGWTVTSDGAFAISGDGRILFDEIDPFAVADELKAKKDWASHGNLAPSVDNNLRRLALVLGNWGVGASAATVARVFCLPPKLTFVPFKEFRIAGPYPVEKEDSAKMVDTVFDATVEAQAKSGETADWPFVLAPEQTGKKQGFLDFKRIEEIKREKWQVSYASAVFESSADYQATLRFGLEWRGKIWVNGEEVFVTYDGKNKPDSNLVPVKIRKGKNVISFKIGNGRNGNYFYANLQDDSKILPPEIATFVAETSPWSLYRFENSNYDPYLYIYW